MSDLRLELNPAAISQIMEDALEKVGRPAANRIAARAQDGAKGLEVDIREHRRGMRRGGTRPVLSVGSGSPRAMSHEAETGFLSRALTGG